MRATRVTLIGGSAAVAAMVLSSCGGSSSSSQPDAAPRPTQTIEVDEPFANASLDGLGQKSDLVLQGRVVKVTHDLTLGSDRSITYKQYTVNRTGRSGPGKVLVFVSETVDGVPIAVEHRPDLSQGDEAIWALTTLDKEFGSEGFVLTSSSSILPVVNGRVKSASSSPAGKEASGLQPSQALERLGSS